MNYIRIMKITDQEEIMSFARNRWKDNPKPCSGAIHWEDFCCHNAAEPRIILVKAESETSLAEAIEKLHEELMQLGDISPKSIFFGLSEKEQSFLAKQFFASSHPFLELIPGCPVDVQEYILSDRIEAVALLFME